MRATRRLPYQLTEQAGAWLSVVMATSSCLHMCIEEPSCLRGRSAIPYVSTIDECSARYSPRIGVAALRRMGTSGEPCGGADVLK